MQTDPRAVRRKQIGVVVATTIGLAFGYGNIALICFGLFVRPLSQAFGWTRGQISLGVTVMNLMVVLAVPALGAAIDRWGARKVILPFSALFALALATMALFNGSLPLFYLTMILVGLTGPVTTPAGYNRVLVEWFDRRRGLALGIALAGTGVGGMFLPPAVGALIQKGGFPLASLGLAALVGLVALPVAFFFLQERPPEHAGEGRPAAEPLRDFIRNPAFAKLAIGFLALGIFAGGATVHLAPMLIDRGVAPAKAALALAALAAALTFGRLLAGYLLDRLPAWAVVTPFLCGPLIGLALLATGATGDLALVCAFLMGLGLGADFDFLPYLVSRYFPLRSFARNLGVMFALITLGGALGPLFMGAVFERFGDYTLGLWTLFGLVIVGMLGLGSCGPYLQRGQDHDPVLGDLGPSGAIGPAKP